MFSKWRIPLFIILLMFLNHHNQHHSSWGSFKILHYVSHVTIYMFILHIACYIFKVFLPSSTALQNWNDKIEEKNLILVLITIHSSSFLKQSGIKIPPLWQNIHPPKREQKIVRQKYFKYTLVSRSWWKARRVQAGICLAWA